LSAIRARSERSIKSRKQALSRDLTRNGSLCAKGIWAGCDASADASVRADNNQKPLDLALTGGRQEMVEFLEAIGAKL